MGLFWVASRAMWERLRYHLFIAKWKFSYPFIALALIVMGLKERAWKVE